MLKLSVLIKTFNEELKISKCIESVLAATANIDEGVEIIVADSLSVDATVVVASKFPVKVVQLTDITDRGAGTGVQLGFQYSRGEYIYLIDGDMELKRGFIEQAFEFLNKEERIAGVAGLLEDSQVKNFFDRFRLKNKPSAVAGEVEWLGGGGLYRRAAIMEAGGYAGDRNLKGFEEADLGLRLRSIGWRLMRLPITSVSHTGHAESTFSLIARHWRSGRMNAGGVLLKTAWRKSWFYRVLRMFIHPFAVFFYWLFICSACLLGMHNSVLPFLFGVGFTVCLALIFKKRSFVDAYFSILLWHVSLLGIIRGIVENRLRAQNATIPSIVIKDY